MTGPTHSPGEYESINDLPSMVEAMRFLPLARVLRLFGNQDAATAVEEGRKVKQMARDLDALARLLVPRNWVLFNSLNVTVAHDIVTEADGDADIAERLFVDHLSDVEALRPYLLLSRHRPGLRERGPLIDRALADHAKGRYYAVAHILIAVMDGYVNDLNPAARKGLAARDPDEMLGWDSVISVHGGLKRAHASYTKRCDKTTEEETFELHRHGIVHGTIINYDNPVVACKAWCRLFAVVDWADSLNKLAKKQAEPPPPGLAQALRDAATTREKTRLLREDIAGWSRRLITPDDEGFMGDEVMQATERYLSAWQTGKWGLMAPLLPLMLSKESPRKTTGMLLDEYRDFDLSSFAVDAVRHVAPVIAEVSVTLVLNGETKPGVMTWICEDEAGQSQTPNLGGSWRLQSFGPWAILANRRRTGK